MNIKECKFHNFVVDHRSSRSGIFIQLMNQSGQIAHAEISPLPGYSKESIDDAFKQLEEIKPFILHTKWFQEDIHSTLSSLSLYPSVFFGLESVLNDLCDPRSYPTCKKYALILGSPKEMLERADQIHTEGFRKAKIKVGHLNVDQAKEIIFFLKDRFRLRLDFNGRWPLKNTLNLCAQFPEDQFDYLEEPVDDLQDLKHFPYPFALDETLRSQNIDFLYPLENFKKCIIKPTLHYPFDSILQMNRQIVLSSSFESPIGIRQIEKLAGRLHLLENEHGLDTLRYFEKDLT